MDEIGAQPCAALRQQPCTCLSRAQALFGMFRALYRLVGPVGSRMLQETLGAPVLAAINGAS